MVTRTSSQTFLTLGSEFLVNTETASSQRQPSVAALSGGGFVVTWETRDQDGDGAGIYGQRYDADGAVIGPEFLVNTYTVGDQAIPSVTGLNAGGFVVTWHSAGLDGDSFGIGGQRYDAAGNAVGSEFLVNTYTNDIQALPSVTNLSGGGFVVTWISYGQGPRGNIYGQRYDAAGAAVGSEFRVNTQTVGDQNETSVAGLPDGGFVVTWHSAGGIGNTEGIFGQRYDAAGVAVGSEFQVNTETTDNRYYPSVTALSDGGFVVTWQSGAQDGDGFGIYGQRYDAAGGAVGSEFQINTYTADGQYRPSVAALSDGGFVVTWYSDGQDGSGFGIYGQRFNAAGLAIGSEFQVNTYTDNSQTFPVVAALPGGSFVVIWESTGQDGDFDGVYGQIFGTNSVSTGTVTLAGTVSEEETLTVTHTLADADGFGTVSYQWLRDGSVISGATGDSYTLSQEDVGAEISARASYTDGHGTVETVTSDPTATVSNVNDTPTGTVSISGTATEDQTLTASNTLADEDGLGSVSYQWQRDWVNISGATSAIYTLTQADVGAQITVVASYADDFGRDESVTSSATSAVANVNDTPTGAVSISGTAAEDQTLTASNTLADEDGLGSVSYQWQRDGVNISGATSAIYTLTQADVGAQITVVASYEDDFGRDESVTSSATSAVANVNDIATGAVAISGTAKTGEALTASNTLADKDGLGAISYQWQRGGVDISGATNSSYTLTLGDVGAAITVVARYTDDEGTSEAVSSSATAAIRYGDFEVDGTQEDDVVRGRYGDDHLTGQDGEDSIIGGLGQDTLEGNSGSDTLRGWSGDDLLLGGGGDDFLYGGEGADTLDGGRRHDALFGRAGDDSLIGGWGQDTLKGNSGSDTLRGSRGNDVLFGGKDDDLLYSGQGRDNLDGGSGHDELLGRRGDDTLHGGRGQDTLKGGSGDDLLTGSFGADRFVFGQNVGNDTITDFDYGSDTIEITRGAEALNEITFAQSGDDVLITFAETSVLVENIAVDDLNLAENFLFT
ncbi:hypothetical protein PXK68_20845 [Phaeobacter gallaeciensis]|uniref:hypothetical protein n=1 Tax=Phaeobacter gallaeciensis TaxID=60890 RepID=UPI00237F3B30|nr:hypothetical protein [Phaeobacter gallaeciensis]MDE4264169.1 hypothetical protein [Phaeobacter gallaeciensis]